MPPSKPISACSPAKEDPETRLGVLSCFTNGTPKGAEFSSRGTFITAFLNMETSPQLAGSEEGVLVDTFRSDRVKVMLLVLGATPSVCPLTDRPTYAMTHAGGLARVCVCHGYRNWGTFVYALDHALYTVENMTEQDYDIVRKWMKHHKLRICPQFIRYNSFFHSPTIMSEMRSGVLCSYIGAYVSLCIFSRYNLVLKELKRNGRIFTRMDGVIHILSHLREELIFLYQIMCKMSKLPRLAFRFEVDEAQRDWKDRINKYMK